MNHSDRAESVIWIASYPKSGNTWVQAVVRNAGKSFGFPSVDLDVYKMKAESRKPIVVGGISPQVTSTNTTVLKTHSAFPKNCRVHPELALDTVGFVYVMRNPLDMLLSYINFTRLEYAQHKDVEKYREALFVDLLGFDKSYAYDEWIGMTLEDIPRHNLDHALARFTELNTQIPTMAQLTGGSWLHHCSSWRDAGSRLPSVFLRYEDLLAGTENFLPIKRVFNFSDSQITDAVNRVNQWVREAQDKKIFFNKKSAFYFSQFFSADIIDNFLQKFESELKLLGYHNLFAV